MSALEQRIEDFLQAPLAAAFLVLADRNDLDGDQLADPATACTLASTALRELNPWSGGTRPAVVRADVLEAARPLRSLLAAVLADERNSWWDAPLQRDAQLLLTGREDRQPDPFQVPVPVGPIGSWETYAQKPVHALITSTELAVPAGEPIRSSAHAELACGASDWDPAYPVDQRRLQVAEHARIAEVHSAADWHALSTRYGDPATHHGSDSSLREVAEIDNGLAPTWSALAADYDGVHLSFAGLLSALYVPVSSPQSGTTTLWAWDWECTHWIRSVFIDTTALPQLPEPPQAMNYWQPLG
ncbi:hypothetical protein GCM10023328_33750 [Modestobacter marinus]|uniref:Uncharacterized protein n=1 Tax=Modestobacter marinus TaxID=477641 RepID=A0A846LKA7_9ACTN|nr:hypothetical protein [Modestobacter marinus]NIH66482.1 hypothetical protein [Modestobacter marinus]GGL64020.1 hypothetical protein GCM10011589_20270 [Modestobacter marinus]